MAEVCQELGVRLVAYSPLCLGLLSGRYSERMPKNFLRSFLFSSLLSDPETQKLLDLLKEIGLSRNKTMAQAEEFHAREGVLRKSVTHNTLHLNS